MTDKLEILPGPGTAAHYGGMSVWLGPTASPSLLRYLIEGVKNLRDANLGGQTLAEALAGILRSGDPEPAVPFVMVGPSPAGWAVLLHGPVQVWDGTRWLTPDRAPGWLQMQVTVPPALVVLPVGYPAPPTQPSSPYNLEAGTVPGGGFVLYPGEQQPANPVPGQVIGAAGQAAAAGQAPYAGQPAGDRGPAIGPNRFSAPQSTAPPLAQPPEAGPLASPPPPVSSPPVASAMVSPPVASPAPAPAPAVTAPLADSVPPPDVAGSPGTGAPPGTAGPADTGGPAVSAQAAALGGAVGAPEPIAPTAVEAEGPRDTAPSALPGAEPAAPELAAPLSAEPSPVYEDPRTAFTGPGPTVAAPTSPGPAGGTPPREPVDLRRAGAFGAQALPEGQGIAAPIAGQPVVPGVRCRGGHFNHPASQTCRECGAAITDLDRAAVSGPRPSLGVLVVDDGSTYVLDEGYVIGTDPTTDPTVTGGLARPLVLTPDPNGQISPAHAEVRLTGWDVMLTDRGSASGTFIFPLGATEWIRLPAYQTTQLKAGTHLACGQHVLTFASPW